MLFSDIHGHDEARQRLIQMVDSGRIPHALMLEGPAGTGKFRLARALAQYIHCENRSGGNACGRCPSCLQHESFNHIDTYYSYPVVKGKSTTATSDMYASQWVDFLSKSSYMDFELWRSSIDNNNARPIIYVHESEAISRRLSFTSRASRYRIVIQWLPELMNVDCANKLLKLIEEPYPGSLFIFVSDSPQNVLPTIYSRAQHIELKRLPDDIITETLATEYSVDPAQAAGIAALAQGDMIHALRQLDSKRGTDSKYLDYFMRLMRLAYQRQIRQLKDWSVEVYKLGRQPSLDFLLYVQRLIRENFIYNLNCPALLHSTQAEAQFSSRFAPFINHKNVIDITNELQRAYDDIAANANARITLFDLAVKMIMLIKR